MEALKDEKFSWSFGFVRGRIGVPLGCLPCHIGLPRLVPSVASPGALLTSGGVSPRRFRPEPTPGSPPHLSVPALPKVPEAESAITERSHVGPPAGPRKRLFIHKLRAHGGRSSAPDPTQALFTPTDAQVRQA